MADILIIDTYNMIIRSKLPWTRDLSKNLVVVSFLRMFMRAVDQFSPKKVVFAIDDYVGNSFRKEIFPEYKGNRRHADEADEYNQHFKKQKEIILNLIDKVFPVYSLRYKGYEADDVIASICKVAKSDTEIVIWSADNDLIQLQQNFSNVKIWSPHHKDFFIVPDYCSCSYKCLVGDISDNIPGVKGIGNKTALKCVLSKTEFIKYIGSHPEKYMEYRRNKKIVDLIDNDLAIPLNLCYLLNSKKKYKVSEMPLIDDIEINSWLNQRRDHILMLEHFSDVSPNYFIM